MARKIQALAAIAFLASPLMGVECGKEKEKKHGRIIHLGDATPPIYSCPEGYEQRGIGDQTQCLLKMESPVRSMCKIGEWFQDRCAIKDPVAYICPQGYYVTSEKDKKKDRACAQVLTAASEPHCAVGHYSEGLCRRLESSPIFMICPVGGKKKQSQDCYEWVTVPPVLKCKPGFVLQGNSCVGKELGPCPPINSNHGETLCIGFGCAGKGGGFIRRLGPKEEKKSTPGKIPLCEIPVHAKPREVCPPGSQYTSDKKKSFSCAIQQAVPLEPYCPLSGGVIDHSGSLCTTELLEEPAYHCPSGFSSCDKKLKSSGCCRIEYINPIPTCGDGASLLDGHCVTLFQPTFVCEEGLSLHGDMCKGYSSVPPKVQYSVNIKTTGKHIPPPVKK